MSLLTSYRYGEGAIHQGSENCPEIKTDYGYRSP
ncbi:hypothetical protein AZZ66_003302, partial [Escherichia coli]